jgi:hypothetical protein
LEAHAADDALHDEGVTYYLLLNDLRPPAPSPSSTRPEFDKIDKKRLRERYGDAEA